MHVRISNFGGIYPALDKRALPGDGAQVNRNLLASVPDFRPLATDLNVAVSVVNNPKTVYRLDRKADGNFNIDMTTGWIVNAAQVSYVKGPLNNDTTERTYYTFDDGSAPPRWLDANGSDRRLGVPKPAAAPTVVVNVAGQFTPEDRSSQIDAAVQAVVTAIRASLIPKWRGSPEPGTAGTTAALGYLNLQTPGYGSPATQSKQARLFGLTSYNGARDGHIFAPYTVGGTDEVGGDYSWAFDPSVQPFWIPSDGSTPAWTYVGSPGGSFRDNLAVSYTAYALTYDVNVAALNASLATILMPGKDDGTTLFTADQISGSDGLSARLVAKFTGADAMAKVHALEQATEELRTVMNRGTGGAITAQFAEFFARAETTTYIQKQLETWAARVFAIAGSVMLQTEPSNDPGPGAYGP